MLTRLQKWEAKVIASHVAEFEPPPPNQVPPQAVPPHNPSHPSVQPHHAHHYPPHPMHAHTQYYSYTPQPPPPPPPGPQIKSEPIDAGRYMLNQAPAQQPAYSIPQLPGPTVPPRHGQIMQFNGPPPTARYPPSAAKTTSPATNGRIPQNDGPSSSGTSRIPQVDGPSSSSSSGSPTPPPATYAPRGAAHPSLPQPRARTDEGDGDEAINSDLDDSDSEGEPDDGGGVGAETDIVFCTYDKVRSIVGRSRARISLDLSRLRASRTNGNAFSKTA